MKKTLIVIFIVLLHCNFSFAENYYFKKCELGNNAYGDYLLDLEKKFIYVTLKSSDGTQQEFKDKIKLTTKNRVISEIIPRKNSKFSTQYYLDVKTNSIVRQLYKRDEVYDVIRPEGKKSTSFCSDVKADWDKKKIVEEKKDEELLEIKSTLPECKGDDPRNWTECKAVYDSGDGYKYSGEWKNGQQDGKGIEMWKDGRKYVGEFKNDKRHGKGIFTVSDGTKYEGEYKENKQDGKGTLVLANGDKYEGDFKNGKQHGKGIFTFSSGKIHTGQFIDGKIIKGTAKYPDGSLYNGNFQFDKPHGQGNLTYSNGAKYSGPFLEGYEAGEGTCFKPDGSSQQCIILKNESYLGRNNYKIEIVSDWSKLKERSDVNEKLINDFNQSANKFCSAAGTGIFKILNKKMEVKEIDETPAWGLDPVYKFGINGKIKCI